MKEIKIIKQNHLGKVRALNVGVEKSRGEFIINIDADTLVSRHFIKNIVKPFQDIKVGATSGPVIVRNKNCIAGMYQNIEYHYNNLIRQSFSDMFNTGIWFFGCSSCYRKSALLEVGGFKEISQTEDMEVAMELKKGGYKTIEASNAKSYTTAPSTLNGIFNQRARWWVGGIQSLKRNRDMFRFHSNPSVLFLFINHIWFSIYSFFSIPLFIYQIYFWFPSGNITESLYYLFRWFSQTGSFYVLYKIPEWGVSTKNIFGVLSGILSLAMLIAALYRYGDRLTLKNTFSIFFWFPYTIIINIFIAGSVLRGLKTKTKYFIK